MSFNIALNFEDGVTRFIRCNEGETVLDAAYRNQINLPMDCSDGVCGTCKGSCQQGDYDLGDEYLEDALTEDEAGQGMVLTCQMVPSSDCVIAIPAASTLCKTGQAEIQGSVTEVNLVSATAIELKVQADEPLAFLPGQYMNVQVPGTNQTRSYSFSSLPGESSFSFLIRNVPGGLMSSWLVGKAKTGDRLTLGGPLGVFYLRPVARPVLMLAGGTGLAPFLSMLEQLKKTGLEHPVHLVYGVSKDEDLVGLEALHTFAAELEQFTFKTVVSSEASDHPNKGYVTHHLDEAPLNEGDVDVYLCGPPPMVDSVLSYFQQQGVTPHSFHYERFTPSTPALAGEVA
ncbi:benzoate 1,2-dioxygenase electron transfer component BenC [Alcanivorax quisquiliarum]|uniref:Ring-hydroxylating dioxygenase ferredoxin reductase family protein n=1 Tax=Alcanivorax quisquiliarum TaxID=2933565 RepID=A0ABT0E4H0_9GAMM|nr:benzoate 1,2-dioxygenase electron transfer component BenC [Alcanivorax quisquiliarum]MCK0536702.1 ring-hydroxylating dioxygenase ferredoxin reductase family protein [Alcanivorax quisquiliarum]